MREEQGPLGGGPVSPCPLAPPSERWASCLAVARPWLRGQVVERGKGDGGSSGGCFFQAPAERIIDVFR